MLANLNSCEKLTCKPAITLMNIKMIWNAAAKNCSCSIHGMGNISAFALLSKYTSEWAKMDVIKTETIVHLHS